MLNGRWISRAVLDEMLADLSARNADMREQFESDKLMKKP